MKISRVSLGTLWSGVAAACIVLLSGCTSTVPLVEPVASNPMITEGLSQEFADNSLILTLTDNRNYEASMFRFGGDSCEWREKRTGLRHMTASRSIRSVAVNHTMAGIRDGLVAGVLVGLPVGISIGNASTKDDFAGAIPIVLAPIAGCLVGAFTGHTDEYEFHWFTRVPSIQTDSSAHSTTDLPR